MIGVLGVQGDVIEHLNALDRCGVRASVVKSAPELSRCEGLILPGGESTTVMKLLQRCDLIEPIAQRVRTGMPFWGTCMGMILAARELAGFPDQATLDLLDVTVRRNAFGRQVASAEVKLSIPVLGSPAFPAVFIRAPWIERVGSGVEVLAQLDGRPVMVRQGNVLGTSFHPELTGDLRLHRYFIEIGKASGAIGKPAATA
ncbi:MAG: pyridoxal 5'-phosphate synthase glutaminase subunit PdxT [Candidatus Meridianibacter frigidus]|nr:MAG: pyridoxal 5'-phosphate synthase glutaminase subunit PdxT [Candidatus Eremiobacteraeota bacterium]